ncbi:MAG: hypothetical protein ABGY75_07955, partial [Gemmataceae bacterium]
MGPVEQLSRAHPGFRPDAAARTAFLVFDTESVPDGRLLADVKYPGENLTPDQAIVRAQLEAKAATGSDFLPVGFHLPVAVAGLRVAAGDTL